MVNRTNQMRRIVGLILELVFLVFILGFSLSPSQPLPVGEDHSSSFASASVVQPAFARVSQNLEASSDLVLKAPSTDFIFSKIFIDIPALEISNLKTLFISVFERSVFYVFTTANAP